MCAYLSIQHLVNLQSTIVGVTEVKSTAELEEFCQIEFSGRAFN